MHQSSTQRDDPSLLIIDRDITDTVLDATVEDIIRGEHKILCYAAKSQYRRAGVSTCGLAALSCVRWVFEKSSEGVNDSCLLRQLLSRQTIDEITTICSLWSENSHLEVEDVFRVPLFDKVMTLVRLAYGAPSTKRFHDLLCELQRVSDTGPSAVVITRPPEIILCLKIPVSDKNVFIVFDSHPRPQYSTGLGLVLSTSIDAISAHLNTILAVDASIFSDASLQWQAQLLANFSGHIFIPSGLPVGSAETLMKFHVESSLEILALRMRNSELQTEIRLLSENNKSLEESLEDLQEENRQLKKKSSVSMNAAPRDYIHGLLPDHPTSSPNDMALSRFRRSSEKARMHMGNSTEHQIQGSSTQSYNVRRPRDSSYELATKMQLEFQEEDERLANERNMLTKSSQTIFDCSICFDKHPSDHVAPVDSCKHLFCRECLRRHVQIQIKDHRYPIFCPACTSSDSKSEIDDSLIQQLGISEDDYHILEEMRMVAFSILLHCRRCKESVFVDRAEHQESRIIACPLPRCNHVWCKNCQQTIDVTGPQHSCDGSSELDHLMTQQGWKYCPGCRTPVQKAGGCNHMTCMSPGCNMHFCYICGGSIVRSALRGEIRNAVSAHYRRCRLFEIPD